MQMVVGMRVLCRDSDRMIFPVSLNQLFSFFSFKLNSFGPRVFIRTTSSIDNKLRSNQSKSLGIYAMCEQVCELCVFGFSLEFLHLIVNPCGNTNPVDFAFIYANHIDGFIRHQSYKIAGHCVCLDIIFFFHIRILISLLIWF